MQFIDLSAVHDPGQVLGVIAAALPNSEPRGEPEWRIQNFTANRPTLLILDNFDRLLPAAPSLDHLLASAIHLRLVVTSRAALLLHGEVEYPVGPLALPHRMLNAASSGAVQLFVSRVQALTPTFALSEPNTAQVMRLCELLEGVPLALELAAMRTRTYALGDLLTQLDHPLEVLKADFRDRPERLRSLRATVQWSYGLLDDVDRAVFECCAVFSGPFSPQALAEVWGSSEVLERAETLLEQSLLQRLDTSATLWKMLQPLRELALEHLEGHPYEAVWRERHARHFLEMIEELQRNWQHESVDRRDAFLPHYPNIRAGMVWAVEGRRSDLAYRYLGALGGLWVAFGLLVQEWPLVERVLALPAPEDRATLLRALQVSLDGLKWTGQFQALEARASKVLALCRELGDVEGMARSNLTLARVARERSQPEQAWAITQRIICDWRDRVGDGQPTRRQRMLHASVHLSGALVLLELGRHAQALEYAQLSCAAFREAGDRVFEMNARIAVGHLLVYLNRRPEARTLLLACLHDAVEGGLRGTVRDALRLGLTLVAAEQQDWITLVQFVAFVNDPVGERSQGMLHRRLQRALAHAREVLGEAAYQRAWTTGTQLQVPDIVELAERLAQMPISPPCPGLTPRELEMLALVAQGHPDRRVARLLDISPGTASKHAGNLLGKLGLHNRVELARWAIEHGLAGETRPTPPL